MLKTLDNIIKKLLWILGPSALAILFGFATNSALKSDGFYIGQPRTMIQYINAPEPNTVSMRADPAMLTKEAIKAARAKVKS